MCTVLLDLFKTFSHICMRALFSFYDPLIPSIHIAAAATVGMLDVRPEKGFQSDTLTTLKADS